MLVTNTSVQSLFFSVLLSQNANVPDCGCSRKTGRDEGIQLYQVPAVVTIQGQEVELSIEQRQRCILAIISLTSQRKS